MVTRVSDQGIVLGGHRGTDAQRDSGKIDGHKLQRLGSSPWLKPTPETRPEGDRRLSRDHSVRGLGAHRSEGQFGLKFFQQVGQGSRVEGFGERYRKEVHGDDRMVGPYRVVGDKTRGVEPGFIGRKAWTDGDTAKLHQDGHKFSKLADVWLRLKLNPIENPDPGIRRLAEDTVARHDGDFRPGKDNVFHYMRSKPGLERQVLDDLKKEPAIEARLIDHVQTRAAKFTKNHYVKLDYRETERKGEGEKTTYSLPMQNAKDFGFGKLGKFLHQMARRQSPENINRDAMRESLANDLMRAFGIFAQKLKIIPTTYQDGTPKLLLDGTHMTGPKGEKFSDFDGAIKGKSPDGQLVKLEPDGKPFVNDRGHYEVDTSIKEFGRNKIFMLALGDRDAIGSTGGNKGRVGNTFAAIDPGHSLEVGGQNLLTRRDIHSDMSFDQPSKIAGRCYKNFSIFDQSPFSERMEGVRKMKELSKTGEDLKVFDDYAREFNSGRPGLDFEEQIGAMRQAYEARRDYIVNDVFAERLQVYDYDMAGVGGPEEQEKAKKQALDVLDTLEKITSEHVWTSERTELEHPIVKKGARTEWNIREAGANVEFGVEDLSPGARARLEGFLAHNGLTGDYSLVQRDGREVLSIPKTALGKAFSDLSIANLRSYDEAR